LAAARAAFAKLAEMPGLGSRWESNPAQLPELRVWPVARFRKYVIFYQPFDTGVQIVRVLHASQDLAKALDHFDLP
jgi:toxin ParE1/3/4